MYIHIHIHIQEAVRRGYLNIQAFSKGLPQHGSQKTKGVKVSLNEHRCRPNPEAGAKDQISIGS